MSSCRPPFCSSSRYPDRSQVISAPSGIRRHVGTLLFFAALLQEGNEWARDGGIAPRFRQRRRDLSQPAAPVPANLRPLPERALDRSRARLRLGKPPRASFARACRRHSLARCRFPRLGAGDADKRPNVREAAGPGRRHEPALCRGKCSEPHRRDGRSSAPNDAVGDRSVAGAIRAEMRGAPDPAAPAWLPPLVRDLRKHAGRSLVLAGEFVPDSVWQGARLLNEELGNVGRTVTYPCGGSHPLGHAHSRPTRERNVVWRHRRRVPLGCNPVYTAPADIPFRRGAPQGVVFSAPRTLCGQSAAVSRWHLPDLHPLKSWGDALAFDGTASIIQPLIQPLYDGISPHVLAASALPSGWPGDRFDVIPAATGAEYCPLTASNPYGAGHYREA